MGVALGVLFAKLLNIIYLHVVILIGLKFKCIYMHVLKQCSFMKISVGKI
jgi:hypothetical protein